MEENLTTYILRLHFLCCTLALLSWLFSNGNRMKNSVFYSWKFSNVGVFASNLYFVQWWWHFSELFGLLILMSPEYCCQSWYRFFKGQICLSERVLGRLAFNERINELVTGNLNGKWSFSIEHKNPSYSEDSNNHFLLSHSDLFCLWKRPCK